MSRSGSPAVPAKAAFLAGLVLGITSLAAPAGAAGGTIPLPSPAQRSSLPANPTDLLGADRPNEIVNKAPGPIRDEEQVHVGLTADGDLQTVEVDQRLILSGTGDFSLKIPGPALDVRGLPNAANQPGLRRGAVVWEGFSGGTKTLDAHVTLTPDVERFKLPFAVSVTGAEVRIENRTAIPVPVADAEPVPAAVRAVRDAVRAALAAGGRPTAGSDGVPATLPAQSDVATVSVNVAVPFHLVGEVRSPGRPPVVIDAVVPGPSAPDGVLSIPTGGAVSFTATPAPPDAASVPAVEGRAALRSVEVALWQVLRLGDVSGYLGNPGKGESTTTYTYARATAPRAAPHAPLDRPRPFAIALALVAGVGVLGVGTALWARS